MSREHATDTVSVTVDCETPAGYPLVRTKFDGFNSGIVSVDRYERDRDLLAALDMDSLRFDGGLGGSFISWDPPLATGPPEDPTYSFTEVDRLVDVLEDIDVQPYWSYGYTPPALQPAGDHRDPPVDSDAWTDVLETFADHFREGTDGPARVGFNEVWNEPDLNDRFFTGDLDDYLELYETGAPVLAEHNPDVPVGGPSAAGPGGEDWDEAFLEFVAEKDLPLDFFSFHWYGDDFEPRVREVADHLDGYDRFDGVEMHLNEYNSYRIQSLAADFTSLNDHYAAASRLFATFSDLLSIPALTKVHWAQIQDAREESTHLGLISLDGVRKPAYHAWDLYTQLPVRQRAVETGDADGRVDGNGIETLAGSDDRRVGVVLWNESDDDAAVSTTLAGAPFETGDVTVYRIDADHSSYFDNADTDELAVVDREERVDLDSWSWTGTVPPAGVVYLEADRTDATPAPRPTVDVADVVRVRHHYPDRTSDAYADFDRKSWCARLGAMGESAADQVVGVTAEDLPGTLAVANEFPGGTGPQSDGGRGPQSDGETGVPPEGHVGVRIDYHTADGFDSSVLFRLAGDGPGEAIPWGTGERPDEVVSAAGADLRLPVADRAPEGWTGRVQLTFRLRNTPPETRWAATVRSG